MEAAGAVVSQSHVLQAVLSGAVLILSSTSMYHLLFQTLFWVLYENSFNPHSRPIKNMIIIIIFAEKESGTERLSNFSKVTQLVSYRIGIWIQVVWI